MPAYQYRGARDFWRAVHEASNPHAFEAIEQIVSDMNALSEVFEKRNLGLRFEGKWIERNLSYVVGLVQDGFSGPQTLLIMQLTPLGQVTAQVVSAFGDTATKHAFKRGHRNYRHMNDPEQVEKLLYDIRGLVLRAVPPEMRHTVNEIFFPKGEESLPAGFLQDKFKGIKNPYDAYVRAHAPL